MHKTGARPVPSFRLPDVPAELSWRLEPAGWSTEPGGGLSILSGPRTDLFTDPKDGAGSDAAPAALFTPPDRTFTLSALVSAGFASTYDAGVLHVRACRGPLGEAVLRVFTPGRAHGGLGGHARPVRRLQLDRRARGLGPPADRPGRGGNGIPLLLRRETMGIRPLFLPGLAGRPAGRILQPVTDRDGMPRGLFGHQVSAGFPRTSGAGSRSGLLKSSTAFSLITRENQRPLSLTVRFWAVEVHVHQAEPLGVAEVPLEVVHDRPDEVAADVRAVLDGLPDAGGVPGEVVDAGRVVARAVGTDGVGQRACRSP